MFESLVTLVVIGAVAAVATMTVKSLIIICQPSEVVIFWPKKSAGERGLSRAQGGLSHPYSD